MRPAVQAAAKAFLDEVGPPTSSSLLRESALAPSLKRPGIVPFFAPSWMRTCWDSVHTFHPFIAPMQARGGGVLCGISSVAGVRGLPGGGAYSASKAAATVYLESLRLELKSRGFSVVTVAPGYIDTPMTRVNPYAMPFKMTAGVAATKVARCIELSPCLYRHSLADGLD